MTHSIGLYVKGKKENVLKSANYDLIEVCFEDEGGNLSILRSVDTFELIMLYKTENGEKGIDKFVTNFSNYEADVKEMNISSDVRPVVYWQVEMNVFPFGAGISGGRANKQLLQKIKYNSRSGMDSFKTSLSLLKGYEKGSLSVWLRTADEAVERFDDETALEMIVKSGRDVFVMIDHAPYSTINPHAVFPKFENFDTLCPDWTNLSPQDIFTAVTDKPSAAFKDAVDRFRDQHVSEPDWDNAVKVGYDYLSLLQPIFLPPQHGQDYPEVQRRTITDPVILVATAYSGAFADVEVELWSDKQKKFPANVLGHGPLDYLSSMPAGREAVSALGKRHRPDSSMLTAVVATEAEWEADGDVLSDEFNETIVITEQKTHKTVSGALPQLLSQAYDSMLAGSGQLQRTSDPTKKAELIAKKRFCVLSTGQRYYFFLLLWPDPQRKPSLHYLGMCALPYFPQLVGTTRDSGIVVGKNGELEKVQRNLYELAVAAVVVCLKGSFTL